MSRWLCLAIGLLCAVPATAEVFTFGPNAKHHWPTYLRVEGDWAVTGDQLTNGQPDQTSEFIRLLGRDTGHGEYFIDRFALYTEHPEDHIFVTPSQGGPSGLFDAGPKEISGARIVTFNAPLRDDGTYGRFGISYVHTVPEPSSIALLAIAAAFAATRYRRTYRA